MLRTVLGLVVGVWTVLSAAGCCWVLWTVLGAGRATLASGMHAGCWHAHAVWMLCALLLLWRAAVHTSNMHLKGMQV